MTESLWQQDARLPVFPALSGDAKTDVLIIGGGLAGVLTAYRLRQAGVECLLVEENRIGSGITGHTTAKVTAQHGLLYHRLCKRRGEQAAKAYLTANQQAVEEYAALCEAVGCEFTRRDSVVYTIRDRRRVVAEWEVLQRLGCDARFEEQPDLPTATEGAVIVPHQAQLHPLRFLGGIAEGLPIYEGTAVRELEGTTAVTDRGRITARRVVVATHFPFLNKHGSYFLKLYQHRSYVLALEGAEPPPYMAVDEDEAGLSFREAEGLLLIGGGGHRTGKPTRGWAEPEELAAWQYPRARERARWVAQDCMTLDGLPYVGQYAKTTPRLYVATGFNKWGMTGSMVAAGLLRDLLTETPNPLTEVVSPSRSILTPQLLVNGWEATANLLTPTKPRCPHLGCALKWNKVEHSWDCPCHGSRFDENGRRLDNPATADLPAAEEDL